MTAAPIHNDDTLLAYNKAYIPPSQPSPRTSAPENQYHLPKQSSTNPLPFSNPLNYISTPHNMSLSHPTTRNFPSESFIIAAGVCIFHLASRSVVLCDELHNGERYHFLPKGRRDVGEESGRNAIREGFEESGYRNRLLPLPTAHRQPLPHPRPEKLPLTAEAVVMEMVPMARGTVQYLLFWYVAETLPPDEVAELDERVGRKVFAEPTGFPEGLTLRERVAMEPEGYVPKRTEGTGVDSVEALYNAALYPVDEAIRLLGEGGVQADVVRRGWNGIVKRWKDEEKERKAQAQEKKDGVD